MVSYTTDNDYIQCYWTIHIEPVLNLYLISKDCFFLFLAFKMHTTSIVVDTKIVRNISITTIDDRLHIIAVVIVAELSLLTVSRKLQS